MKMIQTTQQTSFDWETATTRARDAWIAEHVMGLEVIWLYPGQPRKEQHPTTPTGRTMQDGDPIVADVRHYTSDPAADLSVLHAMRSRDRELIEDYFDILVNILHDRWRRSKEAQTTDFDCSWLYPVNFYEVGDYSHAAWLTLRGRSD